jgi:hypothetical protein
MKSAQGSSRSKVAQLLLLLGFAFLTISYTSETKRSK